MQTWSGSWNHPAVRTPRVCQTKPTQTNQASAGCINAYGANLTATLLQQLLGGTGGRNKGAFLDSCSRHCSLSKWPPGVIPVLVDGLNPMQAFAAW